MPKIQFQMYFFNVWFSEVTYVCPALFFPFKDFNYRKRILRFKIVIHSCMSLVLLSGDSPRMHFSPTLCCFMKKILLDSADLDVNWYADLPDLG